MISQDYNIIVKDSLNFLHSLGKPSKTSFYPALNGLTNIGKSLNLGFACYGLKIFKMTGEWDRMNNEEKKYFLDYLKSFQINHKEFPKNYFIDKKLLLGYKQIFSIENGKFLVKNILNKITDSNYVDKKTRLKEAINADNKQAISTLYELGSSNELKIENTFKSNEDVYSYISSLNWTKPWSAGAQFSSLCVYSKTQNFGFEDTLIKFLDSKLNYETGSYHESSLSDKREIINGAMKVISGLDWINHPIHLPNRLIDFCLDNTPHIEGCDIVDFIYVLYMCSKQSVYRKKEIDNLFEDLLKQIMKLYIEDEKGFSYYNNKSQTHYYGLKITNGLKSADIHGTVLCIWAINMVLNHLEKLDDDMKVIKP